MKYDIKKAQEHFAAKMAFTTGPTELSGKMKNKENIVIVDVRDPDSYAKGHIPGAINLPRDIWTKATGLSKNNLNIVYCYSQVCHLAAEAALEFSIQGYPVVEMEGGFPVWKGDGLPVQGGSDIGDIKCLC